MKVEVIFLASCVLFSLIHAHLSHEPMKEPEYCRWTNAFNGTCSDRGNPQTMCFFDF
ncbi:putative defensin-like protein 243 [Arabidopsis thaliana]